MRTTHLVDPHVLARLVELGGNPRIDDPSVVRLYEDLRHHDYINRLGWRQWDSVTEDMDTQDLAALVRALTGAERRFEWLGGSVSAVVWTYRALERREPELADTVAAWVVRRSSNTYAPYGRHRDVVMSADALDELDSLPPEEREKRYLQHQNLVEAHLKQRAATKRRNTVAEAAKQGDSRIIREAHKAANRKKLLVRH